MRTRKRVPRASIAGALALAAMAPAPGVSAAPIDTTALREAVTVEGVRAHQQGLQDAAGANGGTRASGTPGYEASAMYIAQQALAAGYTILIQPFEFAFFQETAPAELEQIAPTPTDYGAADFLTMEYSGSGAVEAATQAVDISPPTLPDNSSTSGCEAADFTGFVAGNIAVLQRGTCTFAIKAANAEAAGAAAVIIFNEGQPGRTEVLNGTLGGPAAIIPVVGTSFAVGTALSADGVIARVSVTATSEIRQTVNLFAETRTGRNDRVVVVGAHLDSVPEGPGIQDNGSGSAAILEIAEQMAELGIRPRNRVRFAWWGAEESGLLGSEHYVANLRPYEVRRIALNLNFDMIGSPNYVPYVYDGDGSDTEPAGPPGSAAIEDVFLDYFDELGQPVEPTAFDGRSDYGSFIAVGIPAGGLFTGAEDVKTEDEAAIYGGTAGQAYDPCYHQACDTFDNISLEALDLMSDAAAHAVLTFAMTPPAVPGTGQGAGAAAVSASATMEFRGPHRIK